MTKVIRIKKGLDIKLEGEAEKTITEIRSERYAVKPTDFIGVFPKLLIKEGDPVKAGSPLFYDKYRESIRFTAPVSGKITEIKRGHKRVLEEIRIESDGNFESLDFGAGTPDSMSREEITEKMLNSGVWPLIRQRPYSVIAEPTDKPRDIFITAFDSAPLAPDYDFIVHNKGDIFQRGLDVLNNLTDGKVYLSIHQKFTTSNVFLNSKNVEINTFSGPHPSGNVGVQINKIDPINKGDIVWYCNPQAVLTIGRLFTDGKYDTTRVIALAGSEVQRPRYFKIYGGSSIDVFVKDKLKSDNVRYISGNVLTGSKIQADGYLGYYDSMITVIPEGNEFEFFGWAAPGFKKFSVSRTFFSWLSPGKKYKLNTNLCGGERAFVVTGELEKVFPFDIYPMQLIKAIMIEDIDLMENLGIYEVDEEDFALCEFVNTSKINIQDIVRKGLNTMKKEMS